jgi:histone acetyltransferase (RNA polymerase elongator complex component)
MSADFGRLRVTHGVGTLEYYRKLGYELDGSYVAKGL